MSDDVTAVSYDVATYYSDVTGYCVPPTAVRYAKLCMAGACQFYDVLAVICSSQ